VAEAIKKQQPGDCHMNITRRAATLGSLSFLAGTSVSTSSPAEFGSFEGFGKGLEDFSLATDAYIYGSCACWFEACGAH
jgi:hypothetical protein